MSNVIRPTFGGRKPSEAPSPGEYAPLRVFGDAAGYAVAMIRDEAAPEGPAIRVVVGALSGNEVEPVATYPATSEGEADAETAAFAILRTLELFGTRGEAPDTA